MTAIPEMMVGVKWLTSRVAAEGGEQTGESAAIWKQNKISKICKLGAGDSP